ncbi:MAG: HD domain-containing protein [Flavobacteriales bacterium]|nr:HD domain-containing protein [Flavobacteriales bacterium]
MSDEEKSIVSRTEEMIRSAFSEESTGHDWWHIHRVRTTAIEIATREQANVFVVELAALLHDIADHKFHDGDLTVGPDKAKKWLVESLCPPQTVDDVVQIIKEVSFKGAGVSTPVSSPEAACVQDADRLDAIGAVGIARCFAYGGSVGQAIHDPRLEVTEHNSFEEYHGATTSSINHFYEKLLLLKDRMNTETGKAMAQKRHEVMLQFLDQFEKEWRGNA